MQDINYEKTFLETFQKENEKIILNQADLNNLKIEIMEWLNRKQRLDTEIKEYILDRERYQKQLNIVDNQISGTDLTKVLKTYVKLHKRIKEFRSLEAINEHFKDGYRLINKIRELFTGQTITYSILFNTKEEIWEANLTMEQLLPFMKMSRLQVNDLEKSKNSITNSMKLYMNASAINQAAANAVWEDSENVSKILHQLRRKDLWNSLIQVHKNYFPIKEEKLSEVNLGRVYEVYTDLVRTNRGGTFRYAGHEKGKQNTLELAKSLFAKQTGENIDFQQSGDYGLIQLKTVLDGSTTKLAGTWQIDSILQQIYQALNSDTKEQMIENLNIIFTAEEDKINNRLNELVRETAIDAIKETVTNAKFDIK